MNRIAVRRLLGLSLLAAQMVASGAASLAHARERYDAPHHIESTTGEQCLSVHDATRCVLCAWSHARSDVPPQRAVTPSTADVEGIWLPAVTQPHQAAEHHAARARAPPLPNA